MNFPQFTLLAVVRFYQALVSPALTAIFTPLGFGCRFQPTCSQYAADAIRAHGACKGSWLALRRLCRCHPWGGCGHDPVLPPKATTVSGKANETEPTRFNNGDSAPFLSHPAP